ncbi:hypothetical protein CONPUDRAFT_153184 [Coniophora puteana RWD-64-598 SS2]|uniref:Uncharacterized protein n=1 Tax=Coniophora puteana (strain RWD-64-598) TaxID=741705 RepID=A0A5M3MT86_CONPW|nr:uncharacterized protein CONPUDRAFT_153184 [Coniophora puteana RWD-64-598 SS2]EIW82300.1 hypothetical protein CONPUDRAFT_153184 [Coniophora puteana RWD-64-598 SS2]
MTMLVFFTFIQTGLSGYIVWQSTVLDSFLGESHVWGFHVFFNGFLCSLTRSYQVFRCWQIIRKWYWMVPLVLLGMGSFAANVIFAYSAMQIFGPHPTSQEAMARFCWKHKTGIEHIDSAVKRYFIVATESSLWPGLCLLIAVILYHSGNVGHPSSRAPA